MSDLAVPPSEDVEFWTATSAPLLELLRKAPRSVSQVKEWSRRPKNQGVIAARYIEHALDWLQMRGEIVREKRSGGSVYRLASQRKITMEIVTVRAILQRWRSGGVNADRALLEIEAVVG